jgi:hydrogenase maturation protease
VAEAAGRTVVVGVGNRFRGDDAAGPMTADALRALVPAGVVVRESDGDPVTLLDLWDGAGTVIVVDTVVTGAAPGTVVRIDATYEALPADLFRQSTHLISVPDAIELSRALGRLPGRVVLYGVEGAAFEPGAAASAAVVAGVHEATERVVEELKGPIRA